MKMIKKLFIGGTGLVGGSLVISGILGASHVIDDALSFLPKQNIEIDTASWIAILIGLSLAALAYYVSTRTPDDKKVAKEEEEKDPLNPDSESDENNSLKPLHSSTSSSSLKGAERNSAATDPKDADATDPKDADATDPKDAEREEEQKAGTLTT